MRIIISFFLSFTIYSLIMFFLYFVFFHKDKQQKKEVYIHTALVIKKNTNLPTKSKKNFIKKEKKQFFKQQKKQNIKKANYGSKSSMTKSGKVNFNDIFKNVNYNVDTKKINLKKQLNISRLKGKILKNLKKIKFSNIDVSYNIATSTSKDKVNELIRKIYEIWDELSFIPGEYATIQIISNNGKLNTLILDSNIDEQKQQELIDKINEINFREKINLTVKFQTKVGK